MNPHARMQNPLRDVHARVHFCERYFECVGATAVHKADDYLEYVLPVEVDKEMVDRPYYWMWIEKTGQEPKSSVMRLAFSEEAETRENQRLRAEALEAAGPGLSDLQRQYFVAPKSELIGLGCYRLDKIYASLDSRGKFAAVMPKTVTPPASMGNGAQQRLPLIPWILIQARLSYRCDNTQQELKSYGICLENGQVVKDFYKLLSRIEMQPMNPSWVQNRMQISIEDGFERIEQVLHRELTSADHTWAAEAQERCQEDLEQVELYYESLKHDTDAEEWARLVVERDRKMRDVSARTTPRVEIKVTNAALVGLIDKQAAH